MGMMPPGQTIGPGAPFNPLQPMGNAFQFPNQIPQQNVSLGPPTQPLSHRRNQSAIPNMGMGPPPAPSSGASGSSFGNFEALLDAGFHLAHHARQEPYAGVEHHQGGAVGRTQ